MQGIVEIYTEFTPNPESIKFVSNRMLLPGESADFESKVEASESPLALDLFELDYVKRVFISNNFVTVTKDPAMDWVEVKDPIRLQIKKWLEDEKEIVTAKFHSVNGNEISSEDSELIQGIKKSLEQYVKPAVETDGGAIQFKKYNEGVVTVLLQGSCSGCPSSTVTLKAGIEGLLKRLHPEVESVVAEEG